MFENMTEQQAREEILGMVDDYCQNIIISRNRLRRETGSPMRPEFTIPERW